VKKKKRCVCPLLCAPPNPSGWGGRPIYGFSPIWFFEYWVLPPPQIGIYAGIGRVMHKKKCVLEKCVLEKCVLEKCVCACIKFVF